MAEGGLIAWRVYENTRKPESFERENSRKLESCERDCREQFASLRSDMIIIMGFSSVRRLSDDVVDAIHSKIDKSTTTALPATSDEWKKDE